MILQLAFLSLLPAFEAFAQQGELPDVQYSKHEGVCKFPDIAPVEFRLWMHVNDDPPEASGIEKQG